MIAPADFAPDRAAARLVRAALRIDDTTADTTALRVTVRRVLDGLSSSQRTLVVAHLAVLVAGFARYVPPEQQAALLDAAEMPSVERDLLAGVFDTLLRARVDDEDSAP